MKFYKKIVHEFLEPCKLAGFSTNVIQFQTKSYDNRCKQARCAEACFHENGIQCEYCIQFWGQVDVLGPLHRLPQYKLVAVLLTKITLLCRSRVFFNMRRNEHHVSHCTSRALSNRTSVAIVFLLCLLVLYILH